MAIYPNQYPAQYPPAYLNYGPYRPGFPGMGAQPGPWQGRPPYAPFQPPVQPPMSWPTAMPSGGYAPYGPPYFSPSSYLYSLPPVSETPPAPPPPPPAPKPEPVKEKPSAAEPLLEEPVEQKPVERPAKKSVPQPVRAPEKRRPATFAEEAGEQVGAWVTRFIEQNPQVEHALQKLEPDALLHGEHSPLNHVREQIQQSWAVRNLMKYAEGPILKGVPAELKPVVKQGLDWLREKPLTG